jgi:alkylation response protein AidB-like acyl-CoA dehydrogenase
MSFDPIGQALSALNKLAGNELLHKYGLYQPTQKIAYRATKEGFRAAVAIGRQWKEVQKLLKPERLPAAQRKHDLFDLSISEDQQLVRDMAQRFAREVMREIAAKSNDAAKAPDDFTAQFAELGLASFAVPESLGGAAAESSVVTQVLIAEDLAYGDMGLAVAALAPIGVANALAAYGSADQQAKYLAPFAGDKAPIASLAISERRPAFEPRELRTRARVEGDKYVITGEKTLVPLATSSELFLVAAELVGRGPQVFIVEAATEGVSVKDEPSMGVRAAGLGALKLEEVRVPKSALLGEEPGSVDYEQFLDRSLLAWCALSVGAAQAVLDYVVPYCNDRKAFGEPISHRQAVAFKVADIATELDAMRLLTWRAAARAEEGKPFHREAYLAHVLCSEKGMQIGTDGVQLLGGHGFTKEHPAERWYRDLRALGVIAGGVFV